MTQSARRMALATLDPETAATENALGRTFTPFPLAVGKARMLAGLGGPAAESRTDPWLRLTLDGAEAALQLPHPVIARLIGLPTENTIGSDIALLLEDALADWLDAAEIAGLPTFRLYGLGDVPPALPLQRTLALRGQSADGQFVQYRAPLRLSHVAARALAEQLAKRIEPRAHRVSLPVTAEIHLAGPDISAAALAGLRPGDGIRLPFAYGLEPPSPFTLHIGANMATVTPETGGYRLTTALRPNPKGASEMDQHAETTAPAPDSEAPAKPAEAEAAKPDLDTLPIKLSFRAGEAALSLGELGTLGAGALIPVPGGAEPTVEILANGRKIGTGELVAVGETRAIRVLSLD